MAVWIWVRPLACAVLLVLAACSPVFQQHASSRSQATSAAASTPSSVSASAAPSTAPGSAAARPPLGFPDLGRFAAVDPNSYVQYSIFGEHKIPSWMFAVSKDVQCSIRTAKGMLYLMRCEGVLRGVPGGENRVGVSIGDNPAKFSKEDAANVPGRDPSMYPTLPAGHKIVAPSVVMAGASQATCVVDGAGMAACQMTGTSAGKDWRHGFVLSPQGSWTF